MDDITLPELELVGEFEAATDESMAFLLRLLGTLSRQAVIDLIQPVIEANPDVTAGAAAAAANAVADELARVKVVTAGALTSVPGDAVTGLTDKDSKPLPGAQFDKYGMPAAAMMAALASRGMVKTDGTTGARATFQSAVGQNTWLSIGPDGGFLDITKVYLQNALHWAVEQERPYVYPGNYIIWLRPDGTLTRLDATL